MAAVCSAVSFRAVAAPKVAARRSARKAVVCQASREESRTSFSFGKVEVPAATKTAVTVALANLVAASPSFAAKGLLFDFDLTLPIIAGEFLLLMTILDKTLFGPVGKTLDDRDALIRSQLESVGGNADEIARLLADRERVITEARSKVAKDLAEAKSKVDASIAERTAKCKSQVDAKIAATIAALDKEVAEAETTIETSADAIAKQIVAKVVEV